MPETQFNWCLYQSLMSAYCSNLNVLAATARQTTSNCVDLIPPGVGPMEMVPSRGRPPFDANAFPTQFVSGLVSRQVEGVTAYPLSAYTETNENRSFFFNAETQSLGSVSAEGQYDATPNSYAPTNLVLQYNLMTEPEPIKYVWLMSATGGGLPRAESGPPTGSVSHLCFSGIRRLTNGVQVFVAYPTAATNDFRTSCTNLDIYACTNLIDFWWTVAATLTVNTATNWISWTNAGTLPANRCYAAGNADLDSDGDGISDSREKFLYHTSANTNDTDGDGVSDWLELFIYGTDPLAEWNSALPYWTGFEPSNNYAVGSLDGQQGWTGTEGVHVQAGMVRAGVQAAELPAGGETAEHRYATTDTVVTAEADFYWGPNQFTAPTNLPVAASCMVSFDSTNGILAFDGNGNGGGTWQTAPGTLLAGQWVALKVEQNYATKKWKLFVNGVLKLSNLGFRNNAVARLGAMYVRSGVGESLCNDDISVSAP